MRKILFLLLYLAGTTAFAQELQCRVSLNYSQMKASTAGDRTIFSEMERAINEFMNGMKWTNDSYKENERIKCSLSINLTDSPSQYNYAGTARFQVVRPVFGTTYETVVFQFVDRSFDFSFNPENRQMMFNEQSFTNNLTSILAFYSLTALSVDYDSFSRLGGNPYVDRLFNIVNLAGNSVGGSWGSGADIRDRYWIMENLRNQQFSIYREGFYKYHRLGLDNLSTKPEESRKVIFDYLNEIKVLSTLRPNATMINIFFDSKGEELVNVFSQAPKKEREDVFKLVSSINPDKTELYRQLTR